MTRSDFDAVPENQKAFYKDLLDTGKLVIEDIVTLSGSTDDPGIDATAYLIDKRETDGLRYPTDGLRDKTVQIHFMNNQAAIIGSFKRAWQYDILVVGDGRLFIIPKHAIVCIEEYAGDRSLNKTV